MKNKTKLIIGLASLLGVTAAAGTTAGFAWFTTVRTATVNYQNANVYYTGTGLSVEYVAVTDGGISATPSSSGNVLSITGNTSAITDISGDGKTFYRPIWTPGAEGSAATSIPAVVNNTPATTFYYVQFGLKITNTGNTAANVYLNAASAVSAVLTDGSAQALKDAEAVKSTRVSIYDGSTCKTMWQFSNEGKGSAYQYLKADAANSVYGYTGVTTADPSVDFPAAFHEGAFSTVQSGFTAAAGQTIISALAGGANKTLTVSIWLEGTLTTTQSLTSPNPIGGNVNVSLALATI